ncbi:MAG: hypothetical protein IIB56_06805 [Planctomycetes bacterium]|nr:hypothetical protein [Planctomycetota bacterium]
MMLGKIKYGKITVVIFLTILIWVWADLALDEPHSVSNARIVAKSSPNLWVSFKGKPWIRIDNIKLKGPASKITKVSRRLNDGSLVPDFSLSPEREGMTTAGQHILNVLDFVKRSDKIKEFSGLMVEACEPKMIDVNVVELVKTELDIECFDENGTLLEVASIEPSKVDMFVPADSRLKARVQLTPRDIEQARLSVVEKTPYVVLAEGQTRQASAPVEIKMPPEADTLSEYLIAEAKLGFTLSANLQGIYKVEVNYNEVVRPFTILATEEAKLAYESQPFQMTLYILDNDARKGPEEEQRREVVYNLPEEFVRRNEIKLNNPQKPAEARFKLIRLTSAPTPPAGVD